jgi:hypothetical protein
LVVYILLLSLGGFGCRTPQNENISITTLGVMVPFEMHGRLSMQKNISGHDSERFSYNISVI